jgi:ABC-2 type transport system ATP-binding protein
VRASVGILTETPGLYERLTVARNLWLFADLYGVADPIGRTRKWLERFDPWERRAEPAGSLSKGMRQKLAIARALVHDPPVVFLDEPTSALDPDAARVVRDAISDLKAEGRTVWLCTHNLDEAERCCDRVAVFSTRLLALDTPARLRVALFGREVAFDLATATDAHADAVRAVPGVTEVTKTGARLLARVPDAQAITPAIVRALVAVGAEVVSVGEVHHSLEEVYREIVRGKA